MEKQDQVFKLEELSYGEAVKRVGDTLADAGDAVLVIDQATMMGFPSLMILLPAQMPVFVWVTPSQFGASKEWKVAKGNCVDTFCKFGAACRDIESDTDLQALCDLIAEVQPREVIAEPAVTAEQIANGEEPLAAAKPSAEPVAADTSWLD